METKTATDWMKEGDKYLFINNAKALNYYDKALKLESDNANVWFINGYVLDSLGRYDKALTCFEKSIELDPKDYMIWIIKGSTLNSLKEYEEAIKCFDKAIELNPETNWALKEKGISYVKLHSKYPDKYSLEEAKSLLEKSGLCPDIIAVYSSVLSQLTEKEKMDIALLMIEEDATYKQISEKESLAGTDKEKHYKTLFIKSRYFLNLLHVKTEEEETQLGVAHYTTPKMLRTLILDNPSPLRLHLINLSNDPSEGRTLMEYLYGEHTPIGDNRRVALSASFTFNRDCLNQFRLYGKDDKKEEEGAGVSIIVKESFFASAPKAPSEKKIESYLPENLKSIASDNPSRDRREALYRCMYVDPETQQVISLGQREEYTFYRDMLTRKKDNKVNKQIKKLTKMDKKQVKDDINTYRGKMDELVGEVQKEMDVILGIIEKHKLNFNIVAELLVDLRCLTKHVAFREEQECRIVKVVNYMEKDENDNYKVKPKEKDYDQLYMDYDLPLIPNRNNPKENYVKEVCFGPHFKHREVYAAELRKLDIHSTRSTHPLA
jgi:tetratricopeptide (TPR) repeat protein